MGLASRKSKGAFGWPLNLAAAVVVGLLLSTSAAAVPIGDVWISEVMYDPTGPDGGREWIEIYNNGSTSIDLSGYTLGWGSTFSGWVPQVQLSGILAPGTAFVVGGPISDANNGNPTFDQVVDWSATPIPNGGLFADGVALWDSPLAALTGAEDPIHAVVFGAINFLLTDETGAISPITSPDAPAGSSITYDPGTQTFAVSSPTPGAAVDEPATMALLFTGLTFLWRFGTNPSGHFRPRQ